MATEIFSILFDNGIWCLDYKEMCIKHVTYFHVHFSMTVGVRLVILLFEGPKIVYTLDHMAYECSWL
jgi:hypothetical protein